MFARAELPADAARHDGVVVMGGPMSASSDEGFPSRRATNALLVDAVRRGVPTLGVCLGAQLLAAAHGAAVRRGEGGAEIGWGPVHLDPRAAGDPLLHGLPEDLTVLHWHGDTFDLPRGAVRLATNARYPNQAFRLGDAAWGLQFHLEADAPAVETFLEAFADEVVAAGERADDIRSQSADVLAELSPVTTVVLDRFARLVAAYADEMLVDAR
jgi:GMP synthase-like glutamine amidotransferase